MIRERSTGGRATRKECTASKKGHRIADCTEKLCSRCDGRGLTDVCPTSKEEIAGGDERGWSDAEGVMGVDAHLSQIQASSPTWYLLWQPSIPHSADHIIALDCLFGLES